MTAESPDWILYNQLTNNTDLFATPPVSVHVAHAFSTIVRPQSRIQISLDFMIVVIAFNTLKLAVMVWVLATDKHDYIVTLGDATASYLRRPDLTTKGQCVLNRKEMMYHRGGTGFEHRRYGPSLPDDEFLRRVGGTWLPGTKKYFSLMGKDKQVFFALL
jgi:hypothetical protein